MPLPIPHHEVGLLEITPNGKFTGRLDYRWRMYFIDRDASALGQAVPNVEMESEPKLGGKLAAVEDMALHGLIDMPVRQAIDAVFTDPVRPGIELGDALLLLDQRSERMGLAFSLIQDTRANRASYPASIYTSALYIETDSTLVYRSDGSAWIYIAGTYQRTQAQLAALAVALTANDTGLLSEVVDYDHIVQWTGAAFTWGPGEIGSGYVQSFARAPNSIGASAWQVCNGAVVAVMNADGTTTNETVPDYTTATYLKLIAAGATIGPTAASGLTTSVSAGTPAGTNSAPAFTGNAFVLTGNVSAPVFTGTAGVTGAPSAGVDNTAAGADRASTDTHTHTFTPVGVNSAPVLTMNSYTPTGNVAAPVFTGSALAGHDHGPNTLEMRRTELLAYYRR